MMFADIQHRDVILLRQVKTDMYFSTGLLP